jgi:hypothetical protein
MYDSTKKSYVLYKTISGSKNNTISVTGLKNNTSYQFKVRAYRTINGKSYFSYFTKQITVATKLNFVTINSVTSNSAKKITVKWNKATYSCTGYEVMWSTTSNFSSNYLSTYVKGRDTLTTTLTTSQSKKKYYVRVRVYNESNGKKTYGSWSATSQVTVK